MDIQQSTEAFEKSLTFFGEEYENRMDASMENLYIKFVTYISLSKLPLERVLVIIEMIRDEILEQARIKYKGK